MLLTDSQANITENITSFAEEVMNKIVTKNFLHFIIFGSQV